MNKQWHDSGRTVERREELRVRGLRFRFRERVDAVWVGVSVFIFIFFVVGWLVGVVLGERLGWFDAPLVERLEDPRILSNVRDGIESRPLLDAVYHPPEEKVYISRAGGDIFSYEPATGLWQTEHPFAGERLQGTEKDISIYPDIVLLRSGNGTDALSNRKVTGDTQSLWGVTSNGGVVRRIDNKWQVLIHDSQFIGSRNRPVGRGQLTSAAVSNKRQWLMVGTREDGIGVYDLVQRRWQSLGRKVYDHFQSPEVYHVRWSQGKFWAGGPRGLVMVFQGREDGLWSAVPRPEVRGAVKDMDVDNRDRLWVIEKGNCTGGGQGCLRLSRFALVDSGENGGSGGVSMVSVLMDEENVYPRLSLGDLSFAHYWDQRLILAGNAGVYSYDSRLHAWRNHHEGVVTASLPFSPTFREGKGIYYGFGGGLGIIIPDGSGGIKASKRNETFWRLPGMHRTQVITRIRHGRQGEALALDGSGNLYGFTPFTKDAQEESKLRLVYAPGISKTEPKLFRWATAFGDYVLFTGPQDAVLHNVVTREYRKIGIDTLPLWLREPEVELFASGDVVYAIAQKRWYTQVHRIDAIDAAAGRFKNAQQMAVVPGLVRGVRDWGGKGVVIIAGGDDGRVVKFGTRKEMLTGLKAEEMNRATLLDVAPYGNGIVIATPFGVRTYDYSSRTWGGYRRFQGGIPPRELVAFLNRLFISTGESQFMEMQGSSGTFRIGGRTGFDMEDSEISDVRVVDEKVYLAGSGSVNLYNTDLRRVTARWEFPGKRRVDLVGIVNNKPLALSGGIVTIGTQPLDQLAGTTINVFYDDRYLWTVREEIRSGDRYLKSYDVSNPFSRDTRCYFHNPASGRGVTRFIDAVAINGEKLAVATDRGLRFYDPEFRTWYTEIGNDPIPSGGNLFFAGRVLATVDRRYAVGGERVTFIDLDRVNFPSGCAGRPINIYESPISVRALAASNSAGEIAYIAADGSVVTRRGGGEIILSAPPGAEQPLSSSLKRVFGNQTQPQNSLLFSIPGKSKILYYDLYRRGWLEVPVRLGVANDSLDDIDIVQDHRGNRHIVTAKTRGGSVLMASLSTPVTGNSALQLAPVYSPGSGFGHEPGDLTDVQRRGGKDERWTFVLKNSIKYFNPVNRQWSRDIKLPGIKGKLKFCRVRNLGVAVSGNDDRWWVAHRKIPHPDSFASYTPEKQEFTALDDKGTIWRFKGNGVLFRLPLPENGDYINSSIPFEIPFIIDPARVNQAFDWDQRAVIDTKDGLRVWDGRVSGELKLGAAARGFSGVREAIPHGSQLWLRTQGGKLGLLTVHSDNRGEFIVWPGKVTRFVRRGDGRHWAFFLSSGWKYWNLISFKTPPGQARITFYAAEGVTPAGLDDQKNIYTWSGQVQKEAGILILPPSLNRNKIQALWQSREREWWAAGPGYIYRFGRNNCPNPTFRQASQTSGQSQSILCFKVEDKIKLPKEIPFTSFPRMIWRKGKNSVDIFYNNGKLVSVDKKFLGSTKASLQAALDVPLPERPTDEWGRLKMKVAQLPNGTHAFNPILKLEVSADNELKVYRPGGPERLAAYGVTSVDTLPPALDTGWLKWKRSSGRFEVQTRSGIKEYTPHAFIRDNRLICEAVDALLVPKPGRSFTANTYGIMQFSNEEINLDDSDLIFIPVEWNRPRGAVHGHFYTYDRVYTANGDPVPTGRDTFNLKVGDVMFSEPIRRGGITGRIHVGNSASNGAKQTLNAFSARGFAWDQDRTALAYGHNGLMIQTAAGIHPVGGYTGFEAVPATGRVVSVEGEGLFFQSGNTWYKRIGPSNWNKGVLNPLKNRQLLKNGAWTWELVRGSVKISLNKGSAHKFRVIPTGNGLAFNCDLIRDAGTHDNRLFVMSQAFLEVEEPPGKLAHLEAKRYAPVSCDRLKSLNENKKSELIMDSGGYYSIWDDGLKQFKRVKRADLPDRKPLRYEIPSQNPRLRFTRTMSGRVTKEIRISDINGNNRWMPFTLNRKRFPFDVVTSIASKDNRLFIGTLAGLQVYEQQPEFGIRDIAALYRVGTGNRSEVISTVGAPLNRPSIVMATSAAGCIESADGKTFVLCSGNTRLNRRIRVEDRNWRFIMEGGRLVGQYKNAQGNFSSAPITIRDGRFPHDRIKDLVIFEDRVFTLSLDGWISINAGLSLNFSTIDENHDAQFMRPQKFVKLKQGITFARTLVKSGVYVLGDNNRLWRYHKQFKGRSTWTEIRDIEAIRGVLDYDARPPLVDRERLRLLRPKTNIQSGGKLLFNFQYRGLDGKWYVLPWVKDRLAIDHWQEFIYLRDQDLMWAATPLGLVSFARSPNGKVVLDPAKFVVIAEPIIGGKVGKITDMAVNERGGAVTVRCNSDSKLIFTGMPTLNKDIGVFTSKKAEKDNEVDPFASRILVATGDDCPWRWTLEGHKDDSIGKLKGQLNGFDVQVVGGRFRFDTVNSVSFFQDDYIEVSTDTGGWFRFRDGEYHVKNLELPRVPGIKAQNVKQVRSGRDRDGKPLLGLYITGKGFTRLGEKGITGQTREFPQFLGNDGFWRYQREGSQLVITTVHSKGGKVLRRLNEGRFNDDTVTGLPVSSVDNGNLYYLLPTDAGFVQLTPNLAPEFIYAAAAPVAVSVDSKPLHGHVLWIDSSTEPHRIYSWNPLSAGFELLPGAGQTGENPGLTSRLIPPGAQVLSAEDGPQDFIRIRWKNKKQRGWTLLSPNSDKKEEASRGADNVLYFNVANFEKFHQIRTETPSRASKPWMRALFAPDHIRFLRYGAERPYQLDFPVSMQLIAAFGQEKRLIVIGKSALWDINLETAMVNCFR